MKVLVILSGGLDSSVLVHHHLSLGHQVMALSFNYGQRHRRELSSAAVLCHALKINHKVFEMPGLGTLLKGSSQTDPNVPVPKGHYTQEVMKVTVVPNRNMIMLAIAVGVGIAHQVDYVSFGAHAGDHAIYPDCRKEFADTLNEAVKICDWHHLELMRPFINLTKADIVTLGAQLKVDFARTWSCYEGKHLHCGQCGTCIERREAFFLAGVTDPTEYEPTAPSITQMVASNWQLATQ